MPAIKSPIIGIMPPMKSAIALGAARDKIQEIFGEKGVAVFDTFAGVFQKVVAAAGKFVGFVTSCNPP